MTNPATTDAPPKPGKASDKKLKTTTVKDEISEKGRTIDGSIPDQIIINPVQEAVEKHAVMAYGRYNPPTTGHEKLIHKVESVAKEKNAKAHIIASHTEGNSKNPLPSDKKVGYLKKVAAKDTNVSTSTKEHPTLLHQAAKLHSQGVEHLTMVAGSDRVKEYHELLHKYNDVKSKHGHYNFKSINVVSAGHRDPDAEGAEGMSGTKLRQHAREGNLDKFKEGLPKKLHKHAEEIASHIRTTKEETLDDMFDDFFDESISAASRIRKASSMRRYETKIQAARKRALMRRANTSGIVKRATRLAIGKMKTRLAGGRDVGSLSNMEKQRIEDLVHKRKFAVKRLAMRLIPQVRKTENIRLKHLIKTEDMDIDFLNDLYELAEEVNRKDTHKRDEGTDSLVDIYKNDTPGEKKMKKEDIDAVFESAMDKEAIPRSGQPRKTIDYFVRSHIKRTVSDKPYRQQMLQKQKIDEAIEEEKKVWDKEPPKDEPKSKLSPSQKAKAKARAKAAGRPYPNLVDNMWASKNEEVEQQGCPLDEDYEEELHELIEEDFVPTGMELYESWGELTEEAEKNGRRVSLNKPFLTPSGPKKRAVYVRHPETGNVVKVNFGDPNMRIKKSNPERRRSFRARHNCENPGPKHKARYWSCKAW